MRNRTMVLLVAGIVLALGSATGAMALPHKGWMGNAGYGSDMMNTQLGYQEQQGDQDMMNGPERS